MSVLLVGLGAAVGAPLRYLAGLLLDERFPWGTLLVNLAGSAALGALVAGAVDGRPLALLGVGLCGGLTTYSSFAVQAVRGGRRRGSAYAVATIGGCLAAAALGHALVGWLS